MIRAKEGRILLGINWSKVGNILLMGGSIAASFTGLGWLGLAVKGGGLLKDVLEGDASAADAGMVAFGMLVQFAQDSEANEDLTNEQRKELLDDQIREFAGDADLKERHVGLLAMVVLAAAHGEMSLEEAAALLNVDG